MGRYGGTAKMMDGQRLAPLTFFLLFGLIVYIATYGVN
jgi:hypothetical protein